MTQQYRGWTITASDFMGYDGTHPDFDASYEGPEDGYVTNGLSVHAMTVAEVRAEIDEKILEMEV